MFKFTVKERRFGKDWTTSPVPTPSKQFIGESVRVLDGVPLIVTGLTLDTPLQCYRSVGANTQSCGF